MTGRARGDLRAGGPRPGDDADDVDAEQAAGEAGDAGDAGEPAGDELRRRLLAAAATVFARHGYAGTKVMDIVREAGLSAGALYGRFESKDDLLREAVVRRSARGGFMAGGARSLRGLFTQGARLVNRPLADAEAMRLEAYVSARREPAVADALAAAHAEWRANVQPLVEAATADGSLAAGHDPEAVLFLFRTLYLGLLLHRGSGLPSPGEDGWVALMDHLARSLGEPPRRSSPAAPRPRRAHRPPTTEGPAASRARPSDSQGDTA